MRRRLAYVREPAPGESAAACLSTVLQFFGQDVAVEELLETGGLDRSGAGVASLVETARAHGLRGRSVRVDKEGLRHLPTASILHWQVNRFVVFERLSHRGVVIVDPAQGRRLVPLARFHSAFTGEAVTFERANGVTRAPDRRVPWWRPAASNGGPRVRTRRRLADVRQMEAADCGAACLVSVFAHFGKPVRLDELRELTGTGRDGVTALSIVEAARRYGLRAEGVRADVDALPELPRGSILHWEFNHFVVFDKMTRNGVRVMDPAHGHRVVPFEEFGRAYTGVAITFEPTDEFDRSGSATPGTWRYLRPVLGQTKNLARILTVSLLIRLVALALPLLTALVVDSIVPRGDSSLLFALVGGVVAIVAYQFLLSFVRANLLIELRTRLDMHLTMGFVDHLVELPYAFFLRRSAGDLMMRLQSNTSVREILTTTAMSALLDGTFAVLYLILLIAISPPLALVVLVIALLQVAVMVLSWSRNQRLMSQGLQAEAGTQSYAYQLLAGIEDLKASGAEHRASDHWAGLYADQVNIALARGRLGAIVESVMGTLRLGAPMFILVVGAYQVIEGSMTLGTMLAASALAAAFLEPLGTLVSTGLQLQLMRSYMDRINDVLDTPQEQESGDVRLAAELSGHVRAERVSFSYNPLGPVVVHDVSLEVTPGQHVAIVGRSGSGKSTLAHLLLGLYIPDEGKVEFDGKDLRELDVRSVRKQLGIVTQRPYLFASSLRENIALSDPSLPLETVVEAAKLACIHDDIDAMPMGYDTTVHDGGATLSGGQQQRIALARALVHRPLILVLDEATSELDAVTEQAVYSNLAALTATTIVIAHRLSTIRSADLILVMDEGAIVESGTHEELARRGRVYAGLVAAQSSPQRPPSDAVAIERQSRRSTAS